MEYSQVNNDEKRRILKGRIAGWESDHWGHEINLLALQANSSSEEETLTTRQALKTLEASIMAARAHLTNLGEETPNDDPTQP
jgi:hypothetical protein